MIFAALLGLFTASASPTAPLSALPPPITELSAQADRVILGEVLTTRNARERDKPAILLNKPNRHNETQLPRINS